MEFIYWTSENIIDSVDYISFGALRSFLLFCSKKTEDLFQESKCTKNLNNILQKIVLMICLRNSKMIDLYKLHKSFIKR